MDPDVCRGRDLDKTSGGIKEWSFDDKECGELD
jgi:hypothetical protein